MTPSKPTPSTESAPASLAPVHGSAARADWYISLKTAQGKWMEAITVSDQTREQAEKHAKDSLRFYEGTTEWRVSLTPNDKLSDGGPKTL